MILGRHYHDPSAGMLNRRDFIGDGQGIPLHLLVGLAQQLAPKNLRRLHRENILPIDRTAHHVIGISKFQSVCDGYSQCRCAMFPCRRENAFDFPSGYQWARRIVHGNELDLVVQCIQSGLDRILPSDTSANDPADLSQVRFYDEMPHRYSFARHNEDVVYAYRLFESGPGILNDRTASDFCQQLVKTSPLTAAGGDDDGGEHSLEG